MADTVSVIIPAYNAEAYLRRAVESALAQTHPPLEVLIVDDGSTDGTAEVAASFAPPVRLIRKQNGGPASARNLGARAARGEWLALLDADDWWFPEKLQAQLPCGADPLVGLVHCLPDHRKDIVPAQLTFDDLWRRNWIVNSSVLLRRAAFEALNGFDEERSLISVEDYNLWIRLAATDWRIVTCPQVLVHYTRGIGLSSHSDRYLQAQLHNIAVLGQSLGLPQELLDRKRNEITFDFARRFLHERRLPAARALFRQAFSGDRSVRNGLHVLVSAMPSCVLNARREVRRLMHRRDDEPPAPVAPAGGASIIDRVCWSQAATERLRQPVVITTIDSEEDFDWSRPFSRASTDVTSMRSQHLAHRIFARYGVVPTYMVDHPVAAQDAGRAPLREFLRDGLCDIGAQLHPWVTPPYSEHVSPRNSYPGNLSRALEFAKIQALTGEIEAAFGTTPRIYRAGRYGVGPNTGEILRQLGYQADSSVVPHWNFSADGGPDFRSMTANPYWIDRQRRVLELPLSASMVGCAARLPGWLAARAFGRISERVGIPSVMSRSGLLERIKLTPEGISIEEAKRLVRHMTAEGHHVFVLTYHSPSLEPGNTPYVRTREDLARFLAWLDEFYDFFVTAAGGRCATWQEVRAELLPAEQSPTDHPARTETVN